jgi:hypothetical protein
MPIGVRGLAKSNGELLSRFVMGFTGLPQSTAEGFHDRLRSGRSALFRHGPNVMGQNVVCTSYFCTLPSLLTVHKIYRSFNLRQGRIP